MIWVPRIERTSEEKKPCPDLWLRGSGPVVHRWADAVRFTLIRAHSTAASSSHERRFDAQPGQAWEAGMKVARTTSAPNLTTGGSSYSLFASGVEGSGVSFEPGIAVDHANQFCQWVADVIMQHGGMMT